MKFVFKLSRVYNGRSNVPNHHICVVVTGKRLNRGIGLELEIPLDYFLHGGDRVIE